MTRKQSAMLAQVIKAELDYRGHLAKGDFSASGPRHFIEVGLRKGQIQTARALVRHGLCEWEGSDIPGQTFIKLNPSITEGA